MIQILQMHISLISSICVDAIRCQSCCTIFLTSCVERVPSGGQSLVWYNTYTIEALIIYDSIFFTFVNSILSFNRSSQSLTFLKSFEPVHEISNNMTF